ncbi:Peptidase M15 [compost metagenome]
MTAASPWPNFGYHELRCKCGRCGSDGREMDATFMGHLQQLRDLYGKPLVITSAFRCRRHPVEAKKAAPGAHSLGLAVDIACRGADAVAILRLATTLPFTGFGISQRGNARFIHLDTGSAPQLPRPMIWSY